MTAGLPLMKSALKTLAKSILLPFWLTVAMPPTDAAFQKKKKRKKKIKNQKSGTPSLIISNEEMEDFIKIVKSLEESQLLIKGISETI